MAGILVDDLFKFWHQWWQVSAWLNIGGSTHGLQGAFLFCEAGEMTYDSSILQLNNNLCSDGSGKRPWVRGLFRCGPGPLGFLTPSYHAFFGATGEKTGCCGSNVSTFCETTRTYNGAFQWTCTQWWKTSIERR